MNLLNRSSFFNDSKSDNQPDSNNKDIEVSLFQKAFFFKNNHLV
ncbi:MAG: hypothetical protein ACQEQP_00640 [Bacillota bacterium]